MLEVQRATVRVGDWSLEGVDLVVGDAEVLAVLGPSGSGKTTLLRAVAGLQALDAGRILWDGDDLAGVPPHRRGFGLVFQDFALFPHLDVGRNVEFGLRMQGVPAAERRRRAAAALERVELPGIERRRVATLSGGEAQRVALARALAPGPRLLLFDEPLGSLDRGLRERLTGELRRLLSSLGVTALYVTHDQEEAFGLADRVMILEAGRALQVGTPEEVWRVPDGEQVARFLGLRNILDGRVTGSRAETAAGTIPVPPGTPEGPVRLVIRPGAFRLDPGGTILGQVMARTFRGEAYAVEVAAGGVVLEAHLPRAPSPGDQVRLAVDPAGITHL
ncbi:MAG: ABC transporter ATP-binding protein [Actinobacteria bacterium]|nr:ABC transporter ATP-binding protein [Actinomycetota bacterium]